MVKCGNNAHMFDKVCGSVFPREVGTDWPIKSGACTYYNENKNAHTLSVVELGNRGQDGY